MDTNLLHEYIREMLTERFVSIGDRRVVLPSDIQGDQDLDLAEPENSRERRAATVLRRFRDGIKASGSKNFGSIGEDLVAAVLGGEQTNTYWDQDSTYSDVVVGETYYSVKASMNPAKLQSQKIGLDKIENLLQQKGGQSISVGIAMISVDGDNINVSWTDPVTLAVEDFDKIRQNQDPDGSGRPKWLYKQAGSKKTGMGMNSFKSLMKFAGTGPMVNTNTKAIILPSTPEGDTYELGTNEIRDKFRETYDSFRLAPNLTKEQNSQLVDLLNQIQEIWS